MAEPLPLSDEELAAYHAAGLGKRDDLDQRVWATIDADRARIAELEAEVARLRATWTPPWGRDAWIS